MKLTRLIGEYYPPADKSISHRALIIAAMARGKSVIENLLNSVDCQTTVNVLRSLGVEINYTGAAVEIISKGAECFTAENTLYCGNSGTTARLLAGVLSTACDAVLDGDASLRKRPMERIIKPLSLMGASISSCGGYMPLTIKKSNMFPADIVSKLSSAQVKSSVLLAACRLDGVSSYTEPLLSRDHTERLLPLFAVDVKRDGLTVSVKGGKMKPAGVKIPGDISSAAFMIASSLIFPCSELIVHNVGLNPTRTAFLELLKSWGADISVEYSSSESERVGSLVVRYSELTGGTVDGFLASQMIDELSLIAMLALFTKNGVLIRGAKELRYKESDRIAAMGHNLRTVGADVDVYDDGIAVSPLDESRVNQEALLSAFDDHRIAMVNIILAKRLALNFPLEDLQCINISYPEFVEDLNKLMR